MTDLLELRIGAHDPGGKSTFPLPPGVTGSAAFSGARDEYRTLLTRRWSFGRPAIALWIGMNPSTARGDVNDPTIIRECNYTREQLVFDQYIKANVMDYRATSPKDLLALGVVPCSQTNLGAIMNAAHQADRVILAFGALPKLLRPYAVAVVEQLEGEGIELFCLGLTKDFSPRHPLYLRKDTPMIPFPKGNYR